MSSTGLQTWTGGHLAGQIGLGAPAMVLDWGSIDAAMRSVTVALPSVFAAAARRAERRRAQHGGTGSAESRLSTPLADDATAKSASWKIDEHAAILGVGVCLGAAIALAAVACAHGTAPAIPA